MIATSIAASKSMVNAETMKERIAVANQNSIKFTTIKMTMTVMLR